MTNKSHGSTANAECARRIQQTPVRALAPKSALFCQLPIGARFEFRGRRYEKLALSLARDEECCGNVFQDGAEVLPADGVKLVGAEPLAPQTQR